MPDVVMINPRKLYAEDFATGASFAQTTDTILGLGSGITVTPIVSAVSDAAAAAAGVPLGAMYLNVGGAFNYLKARLT